MLIQLKGGFERVRFCSVFVIIVFASAPANPGYIVSHLARARGPKRIIEIKIVVFRGGWEVKRHDCFFRDSNYIFSTSLSLSRSLALPLPLALNPLSSNPPPTPPPPTHRGFASRKECARSG